MNIRGAAVAALPVLASLCMGCIFGLKTWGRSMDDFVIEEGGMIIGNSPTGMGEIDLDSGAKRDLFDKPAGGHPYIAGWRKDRVWRTLCSGDNQTVEGVSPYAGVVERHTISKFKGEDARWVSFLGHVSREVVLAELGTGSKENVYHVCLFNTITGKIEEIWKYKSKDLNLSSYISLSPDGSLIAFSAYKQKEKEHKWDILLFDREKSKLINLTKDMHTQTRREEEMVFSSPQFSPATGVLLFYEWHRYVNNRGLSIDVDKVWSYDPKTGKMESLKFRGIHFEMFCGSSFAPDGKRAILKGIPEGSEKCFIYDISTGVIAQVPMIDKIRLSAGWSPSGRYLAYYCCTRYHYPGHLPIFDVYIADVITGQNKMVWDSSKSNRGGTITWIAPPATKREVNINYLKWLVSLLDRGIEKEKVRKRLQEFTNQKASMKDEEWKKWLEENEDYLAWSEKEKRLYLCAEAKSAKTHVDAWETITEGKRVAWAKLSEQEQKTLRDKAASDLSAQRKLEKAAWRAGVDPEVWVHIPEDKQKTWPDLKAEDRIKLVAEGKKKLIEQRAKLQKAEENKSETEQPESE